MRQLRTAISLLLTLTALLLVVTAFCLAVVDLVDLSMHLAWTRYQFGYRPGDGNSPHYLFYSGFGSIVLPPILTVGGLALIAWWHGQCSVSGCFWPSRRRTAAGEKVCWRHRVHKHRTWDDICAAHHLYLGSKPGRG